METKKPQLTISLLASDRLDTLPKCLDSLKPIMDAIPCELILIDTSKNPKVHELLLQYTDQVYEFKWCNDFAKARNEGLRRATGEWFMYLDDDEWFVETDDLIDFFKSGEYYNYGFANYQVRNFLDESYTCYSDSTASRLIRLDEDTHFVSKVHEYFTPIKIGKKNLNSMVYHSGYIYETEEKKQAHFERNCSLLLQMIKEEPTVIRWRLQLAQEYLNMGKWEETIACCTECISAADGMDSDYISINIGTFYAALATAFQRQKKYEEVVKACKNALSDKRSREVLQAMMHLKLGEALLSLGRNDESIKHVEEYLSLRKNINQKDFFIIEQLGALGVGNALNENNKKVAYCVLICSNLERGNLEPLVKYYDKIGWDKAFICAIADVEKYMSKAMWSMEYHSVFVSVMRDVLNQKDLRVHFRKAIIEQEVPYENSFQEYLYMLMQSMQVIVDGPKDNNWLMYYDALKDYVQAVCQWSEFLESQVEIEQKEETPCYVQAAIDVADYLELESQDRVLALSKLKDAVEKLPEFAKGIGDFIGHYAELQNQREAKRNTEMDMLRKQVIEQARLLIESGQTDVAMQIIGQLKQMFPNDEEIQLLEMSTKR